ncbi:hypothetical protein HJC23_006978 [Cyclotella cryptica]|uniref:Tyrosine specific protein phosphatases domain-containing protein n=1 Tax=Cyclotella cryptica TaxID=29204 RepID=A0ABD3QLY6_9STRA|eukprot:CCRYP_004317-RA/>CCRYP_004317-RA protein AED:0.17 eAED:0.22 QI:0/0/0/1/1/1/2/0/592
MQQLPPLPPLTIDQLSLTKSHGFNNKAHWVIPNVLMQGAHPSTADDLIPSLVQNAKCTTFLSLQAEVAPQQSAILIGEGYRDWSIDSKNVPSYSQQVRSVAKEFRLRDPIFLHYGIRDCQPAKSIEDFIQLVAEMIRRIQSGEIIYLHCMGGKGRSGLVAACVLGELYPDVDVEIVLEYIHKFCQLRKFGTESGESCCSPETDDQKEQRCDFCDMRSRVIVAAIVALRRHNNSVTRGFMLDIDITPAKSILLSFPEENRSLASKSGNAQIMAIVVCTATLDCSAVNEYVHAHYQQAAYFTDRGEQQFHDARILQSQYDDEREMLADNGLAIINSPPPNPVDWTDVDDIQISYLPLLGKIVSGIFPAVMGCCFWNPMIRGEHYEISRDRTEKKTPTANIASMVHIDTDVGAFDIRDFLEIVDKNKVQSTALQTSSHSFREMAQDAILNKTKRFVILNFWRNIGLEPVSTAPLAILSTRYDNHSKWLAFPDASPNDKSQWYIFPNVTRDDVIVFYQYDRNVMQISDLFHCAISPSKHVGVGEGRRSFDIRALIILDEVVPKELDRYTESRTRPVLTLEESGCFCDDQSEKRKTR